MSKPDPFLAPVANPPLSRQFDCNLHGADMTVACMDDPEDGFVITHVQLGGLWFWACDVLTQDAITALEASRSFSEPDYQRTEPEDAAADLAACRYQRELDARASQ